MHNYQIIQTNPGEDTFALFAELPKLLYEEGSQRFILGNDPADRHLSGCFVLLEQEKPIARCAFYENPALTFDGNNVATIGSFECINDQGASDQLLGHVMNIAKEKGYSTVIGPMEGSTWNNYRFSDHNNFPNFFMEPYHHDYYGKLFENFGFKSMANYVSNLDKELKFEEARISKFETIYKQKGAKLRSLNMDNLEEDLRKLARFNNDAFSNNLLFTPISEDDFVQKYIQYRDYFNPELIWIVEDEKGEIHALSFSIKDYLNRDKETLIIKSLARRTQTPFRGIGTYLIHKTYQLAKSEGYDNILHALMIQDNASVNISEKYDGTQYKSYTLYKYEL